MAEQVAAKLPASGKEVDKAPRGSVEKPKDKPKIHKTDRRRAFHKQLGPKRQGAGGFGWGKAGEDHRHGDLQLDPADPMYDSDEEGAYVLHYDRDVDGAPAAEGEAPAQAEANGHAKPHHNLFDFSDTVLKQSSFKQAAKRAAKEFLVSHVTEEFLRAVEDIAGQYGGILHFAHQVPKTLIRSSMDAPSEDDQKLISELLLKLKKSETVTEHQFAVAFRQLFQRLDDLVLDVPDAEAILLQFLSDGVDAGFVNLSVAGDIRQYLELADEEIVATKNKIKEILEEYLAGGELGTTVDAIASLATESPAGACLQHEAVKKVISLSLDMSNKERELASAFLSEFAHRAPEHEIEKGLSVLIERAEDLSLDIPDAVHLLGIFVARAVYDEVVAPAFLCRLDVSEHDHAFKVLKDAEDLLNVSLHSPLRLYNIWTPARSVADLKLFVSEIVEEYFDNADGPAAIKDLNELAVPFFMHELVKRGFVLALEHHEREQALIGDFLAAVSAGGVLSNDQLLKGLKRIKAALKDISLDAPKAPEVLDHLLERLTKDGLVSAEDLAQI